MLCFKFLILFLFYQIISAAETEGPPYSCYTCLGRDLENCDIGEAKCNLGCMKIVDASHQVVAKGCATVDIDNGFPHTLDEVKLPWANNTPVSGPMFTCHTKFCNSASSVSFSLFAVLAAIFCALLLL